MNVWQQRMSQHLVTKIVFSFIKAIILRKMYLYVAWLTGADRPLIYLFFLLRYNRKLSLSLSHTQFLSFPFLHTSTLFYLYVSVPHTHSHTQTLFSFYTHSLSLLHTFTHIHSLSNSHTHTHTSHTLGGQQQWPLTINLSLSLLKSLLYVWYYGQINLCGTFLTLRNFYNLKLSLHIRFSHAFTALHCNFL